MPWINVIDEKKASDQLKEIYDDLEKKRGKISNIMKIQSLNPEAMKKHLGIYMTLMFSHLGLSREERELIAVIVSSANQCEYCIYHHAEALNHYWKDDEKIKKVIENHNSTVLSEKKRAMAEYAFKLTKKPYEITQKDVDLLKKSGFSDEEILNINLITSYFNFVNRIALGLGVEFTQKEISGYKY